MHLGGGGGGVDLMYVISVSTSISKIISQILNENSPFTCKYFTSN